MFEKHVCMSEKVFLVSLQENPVNPLLAKARAIISEEEDDNSYINDSSHTGNLFIKIINNSILISILNTIIIRFKSTIFKIQYKEQIIQNKEKN